MNFGAIIIIGDELLSGKRQDDPAMAQIRQEIERRDIAWAWRE